MSGLLWVLFPLLAVTSHGNGHRRHSTKSYRHVLNGGTWMGFEGGYPSQEPVTNQYSTDGGNCGGCCGCGCGCGGNQIQPNAAPQDDGKLQGMILKFYQDLKADIAKLNEVTSNCCGNAGRPAPTNDFRTLLNQIIRNQGNITAVLGNLLNLNKDAAGGTNAFRKQIHTFEATILQFQAHFEKLQLEITQQVKNLNDRTLCQVSPDLKKIGKEVGNNIYTVTESPISGRWMKHHF